MSVRTLPLLLLAAQLLGACSISGLLPDWTSDDAAGPEPAAYRFFIANRLTEIAGAAAKTSRLEISRPQRVDSTKGASWVVCLKLTSSTLPLPRYYAVFFQRGEITDSRLSVLIDHCELQTYAPFDWVADANAPPH